MITPLPNSADEIRSWEGARFMQWYMKVLRQYADFEGRARRTEYWMYILFTMIIVIVLTLLDLALFGQPTGVLGLIYSLATLLPSLGVVVRRLHDTGRSGWWFLISLVPLVGGIVLIVFLATEGTRGTNAYGADPKAAHGAPVG
jgi:uncharacterized membrane protein YhaH (DUF805 family)